MNENEFLRGIEGEEQNGTDLVSGAEHLVRLKIQSGQQTQQQYPDLELEKQALAGIDDIAGLLIGNHMGKKQHERGEEHSFSVPQFASLMLPGGIGYQVGRYIGHNESGKKSKTKEADLSESIGTAAMCKGCGKVKEACGCYEKKAASELLKTALREKLASGAPPDWNKAMLAATTGLGALAGGVGTYFASRAQKDTGKSKMEEDLGSQVEANKMKPERGFLQKLKNRETESAHGFARAFREHPVKASLLGTLTGAVSGYGIGQLGGAIARRGGK